RALLWGIFASVALCFLLLDLCLTADLLATRGQIPDLPIESAPEFSKLFLDESSDGAGPTDTSGILMVARDEAGLRSVAWRFREAPVLGPVLRQAYRRISWFHENTKSLVLLVLIGF